MKRREFLGLAALPLAQALNRPSLGTSQGRVIGVDGADAAGVDLVRKWTGPCCRSHVVNRTSQAVRIGEVTLFDLELNMPPGTALYGEGFQMLTQTGGTLGAPADFSQYTDAKHYRIPEMNGARAFYGLLTLTPPAQDTTLLAFTSCARFSGRFRLTAAANAQHSANSAPPANLVTPRLAAVIDTEGLMLRAGETWELEELMVKNGADRARLLSELADRLRVHHPPLPPVFESPRTVPRWPEGRQSRARGVRRRRPAGARGTASARGSPRSRCSTTSTSSRPRLSRARPTSRSTTAIRRDGRLARDRARHSAAACGRAATRSAAAGSSRPSGSPRSSPRSDSAVFHEHPDWFIKDDAGQPLPSDRVTFGGWRRGPWYALDGTHPEVQKHLE